MDAEADHLARGREHVNQANEEDSKKHGARNITPGSAHFLTRVVAASKPTNDRMANTIPSAIPDTPVGNLPGSVARA